MTDSPAKSTVAGKKAEVKEEPKTFEFRGIEFTIPPPLDIPDDVLDTIEEGGGDRAIIRSILGPEQWAKYKSIKGRTIRDFNEFMDKVADAAGFGDAGNSLRTAEALAKYSDELEADLLEFFGVDLLDLWRGKLSLRRIHVLIQSLYSKIGRSVLVAALDAAASWSETEHLLARISDAMEVSNYLFIKANSSGSSRMEPPKPIPRPGQVEREAKEMKFATGEELAAFFAGFGQA